MISQPIILNEDNIIPVESRLEQENYEDVLKFAKDIQCLKEVAEDMNKILEDSGILLEKTDEKISKSKQDVEITTDNIKTANQYFFTSRLLKSTAISAIVGLCIGGPIGGAIGYTIGTIGLGILTGSVVGSVGSGTITHAIVKKKASNK